MTGLAMSALSLLEARCQEWTPDYCGVYLLISGDEIVYVGSSRFVHARFESHTNDGKEFDRALWFRVPPESMLAYEGALIRRLAPRYNTSAPAYRGDDAAILAILGLPAHEDEAAAVRAWREKRSVFARRGYYLRKERERAWADDLVSEGRR